MARIGLVIRADVEEARTLAKELVRWAAKNGHELMLEEDTARALSIPDKSFSAKQIAVQADPVVTLGGDGTLIGIGRYVGAKSPVMLGVNFGQLGFLTEILPAELFVALGDVLSGKALCAERAMLQAEVHRGKELVFSSQAVNDVVVQRDIVGKLINLDFSVDDEEVMRLRGDGLIVATPTGSTAYSLSAGGSIAYPTLDVMLITPVCPHSLTYRPLVLSLENRVEVRIPNGHESLHLIVDGQVSVEVRSGDRVKIQRSPNKVRFVRSSSKSYFDILRKKLNWGRANKS